LWDVAVGRTFVKEHFCVLSVTPSSIGVTLTPNYNPFKALRCAMTAIVSAHSRLRHLPTAVRNSEAGVGIRMASTVVAGHEILGSIIVKKNISFHSFRIRISAAESVRILDPLKTDHRFFPFSSASGKSPAVQTDRPCYDQTKVIDKEDLDSTPSRENTERFNVRIPLPPDAPTSFFCRSAACGSAQLAYAMHVTLLLRQATAPVETVHRAVAFFEVLPNRRFNVQNESEELEPFALVEKGFGLYLDRYLGQTILQACGGLSHH